MIECSIKFKNGFKCNSNELMFSPDFTSQEELIELLVNRGIIHRLNLSLSNYDIMFQSGSMVIDDAITGETILECVW